MKEENKKTLSEYRMEKAFETLEDSGIMLEKGHLHSCVNRIYYSVFYAVNALLTHFLQWKLVVAQFIEHSPMNRATTILCNIDRR